MFWYEAIVKYVDEFNDYRIKTDKVIVYSKDYAGAAKSIVEDYGEHLHSFLIGEAIEGDCHTYTCELDPEDRFAFLRDWNTEDITYI